MSKKQREEEIRKELEQKLGRGKELFKQDIDAELKERMDVEYGVASDRESRVEREGELTGESIYGVGEITGSGDIPDQDYREHLIHLMLMQADSELAGALGYVPCIAYAPSPEEYLAASMITKDEFRHGRVVYKLLEHLGVDIDEHMKAHDFTLKVDESDLGTRRVASDLRVNIFYYKIPTWVDFIMFQFCMDRGAGHQLEDVLESSYKPWARVLEGIFKEELFHIAHGDSWVRRLASDPETKPQVQASLNTWFPRTMNIFGRPDSPKNKIYRQLGIKKRDNHDVRLAFAAEVAEKCQEFGLEMPEWKPDWGKLPEEAFVTG